MNAKRIELPEDPQDTAVIDGVELTGSAEVLASFKQSIERQRAAITAARPALERLVEAMAHKTGQSYHLRELLFSLWNGKPAMLLDVVHLDFELRQALCAVIQAWGCGNGEWAFFYGEMQEAISAHAGLWDWFLEESENLNAIREYAKHGH